MNRYFIKEKINKIKKMVKDNTVYVMGHKTIDVDSYISSLLMANLLKKEGINAKPIILCSYKNIDRNTKFIIEKLNCKKITPDIFCKKDYFFLVDHNNPYESFKEVLPENIVGIVDHHQDENFNAIFKVIKNAGSTTKIIYDIYCELGYELSYEDKKKILYSLSVDTCALMSSKAQESDKKFANILCRELNIDFNKLKKETLFETDLNKPVEELLKNGYKEYNINGFNIYSSYVEYFGDSKEKKNKIKQITNKMIQMVKNNKNHDGYVLIFIDFHNEKTDVYIIKDNSNVINMTFDYVASRGYTILPIVRKIYSGK